MTDRRLTPNRDWTTGETPGCVAVSLTDLLAAPDGPRDRQLLMGDAVTVLGTNHGTAHVRAEKDGYHGFVAQSALGPQTHPTHRVSAPATHAYAAPDIKSPDRMSLSYGSHITATGETGDFIETDHGFLPRQHLMPCDQPATDPALETLMFLGTPYLWGGNSRWGVDCSGLVQSALLACAIPCPGDSDLQQTAFGPALPPGSARKRGDLLFWKGHVALVHDAHTMIHANAHHMMTRLENIEKALRRLDKEGIPLAAHIRP